MSRILRIATVILFGMLMANVAQAATSQWHDLGGGKARLIAVMSPVSGALNVALEVDLEEGWSTYWRNPGNSGIPPVLDFSRSSGISFQREQFPSPKLISANGVQYAGYKNRVTFVVDATLLANVPGDIHLNLLIGLCREVCIPAQAEMKISGEALLQTDPIANQLISMARFSIPKKVAGKEIITSAEISDQKLDLELTHPAIKKGATLFVEGPADWYLSPVSVASVASGKGRFQVDLSDAPHFEHLPRGALKFTLVNGGSGIEFTH